MRAARLIGSAVVATAAARALPALAPVSPPVARAFGIPLRAPEIDGVALTFDDGPHAQGTPAVLEVLAAANARATFFLVGEQVRAGPSLAAEIAAAGHAVAIHGDRHRVLSRLPGRVIAADIDRARQTIADACGSLPAVHRPPLGIYSRSGLRAVRELGLRPLLWSRWGRDWSARESPESVATRVTRDLHAGDVLLLHDADHYSDAGCWRTTVAALPAILAAISDAGLRPALPGI
jgi:peptidoglycan-N-acetylglucosamine deacetylase